jgi:hypothetical protein
MYANHPEMAKEWSEHTAKGTKLPEYVKSAMNTQEQAYIQGFVKRASEYGFNNDEAISLFKQALLDPSLMGKKAPVAKPPMKPVVPKPPNPNEADMNDIAGYKKANARELALEHNKANIPLQTLLSGGIPGMAYNAYKDIHGDKDLAKDDLPSRFLRISGGSLLGQLAGGALGYGASSQLGIHPAAIAGGAMLGGWTGGALGANSYNNALDELKNKRKI